MNLLKEVAVKTHSKALQKLATEIGTFAGPFDKINKMELLNAKIATAEAEVADLTKEIADDDQSASDITTYMEEEKELRKENHNENVATIKDAQDAQQAVADATAVLKNFYKESGQIAKEPYEFVQTSDVDLPENPSTW